MSVQQIRLAARALAKAPAATGFAIASLALGIGANTAAFSLWNAVMLRTAPVREPQQLVALSIASADAPYPENPSVAMLEGFRRAGLPFSSIAAWSGDYRMANFQVNGVNYSSTLCDADAEYFAMLGYGRCWDG